MCSLRRNKSHGFSAMHLKEIIKTQEKIKNITPVVYSECVLKVRDSGHFSELPRADMLTRATDKRMHSSMKPG